LAAAKASRLLFSDEAITYCNSIRIIKSGASGLDGGGRYLYAKPQEPKRISFERHT
jgi:hypothetical protein